MTEKSNPVPGVHKKMAAVQKLIRDVPKSGRNPKQGYSFRTIDDVVATVKAAMDKVGLTVSPTDMQLLNFKEEVGDRKTTVRVLIKATYAFCDPDDGSYFPIAALGEGVDYGGDKATYKAMTGAQKYALTQALTLPCDGFDPEAFEEQMTSPVDKATTKKRK
jgi:hypothetical protein